jgi:hypothetical protein
MRKMMSGIWRRRGKDTTGIMTPDLYSREPRGADSTRKGPTIEAGEITYESRISTNGGDSTTIMIAGEIEEDFHRGINTGTRMTMRRGTIPDEITSEAGVGRLREGRNSSNNPGDHLRRSMRVNCLATSERDLVMPSNIDTDLTIFLYLL